MRTLSPGKAEQIRPARKEIVKWRLAVAADGVDLEVSEMDRQMTLRHPAFPAIATEVTDLLVPLSRLGYLEITLECLKQKRVQDGEEVVQDPKAQRSGMKKKTEKEQYRDWASPEAESAPEKNAQQLALPLLK